MDKLFLIFWGIKNAHFRQQVIKPPGSYKQVFTVSHTQSCFAWRVEKSEFYFISCLVVLQIRIDKHFIRSGIRFTSSVPARAQHSGVNTSLMTLETSLNNIVSEMFPSDVRILYTCQARILLRTSVFCGWFRSFSLYLCSYSANRLLMHEKYYSSN